MNDHSGHRQRLRQKFTDNMSLDGFDETSILELLLFYSIPRVDTRETARTLLNRFGSLKDVLEAPYEELISCHDVGASSAVLIKLIPSFAKAYYSGRSAHEVFLTDEAGIKQYLSPKFAIEKDEICVLLSLDNKGLLLSDDVISQGGRNFAEINIDDILSILKKNDATSAIIAHNHPAGLCVPSHDDTQITKQLIRELSAEHINLADHLIFADGEVFSYAGSAKFSRYF